jgi:hypothetical protein
MTDQFGEGLRAAARPIAQDLGHGNLEIVVEYRQRTTTEKGNSITAEQYKIFSCRVFNEINSTEPFGCGISRVEIHL